MTLNARAIDGYYYFFYFNPEYCTQIMECIWSISGRNRFKKKSMTTAEQLCSQTKLKAPKINFTSGGSKWLLWNVIWQ